MAQFIENSQTFPLQVTRTADGRYTVEAVGLGLGKTGANLAEVEAAVRAAVAEIQTVGERHALETMPAASSATTSARDTSSIECMIMRWARIALVVIVAALVVEQGIKQTLLSQFDMLGEAKVGEAKDTAKSLAKAAAKIAQTLESVTPDRRYEVTTNLHRIAVSLEPYAAQMRPLWMACCDPQSAPLPPEVQDTVKKAPPPPATGE